MDFVSAAPSCLDVTVSTYPNLSVAEHCTFPSFCRNTLQRWPFGRYGEFHRDYALLFARTSKLISYLKISTQIRFFLLQNRQGKTRLSKWYATPPNDSERVKLEVDVNRVISSRSKGHTNFVEVCSDGLLLQPAAYLQTVSFLSVPFYSIRTTSLSTADMQAYTLCSGLMHRIMNFC